MPFGQKDFARSWNRSHTKPAERRFRLSGRSFGGAVLSLKHHPGWAATWDSGGGTRGKVKQVHNRFWECVLARVNIAPAQLSACVSRQKLNSSRFWAEASRTGVMRLASSTGRFTNCSGLKLALVWMRRLVVKMQALHWESNVRSQWITGLPQPADSPKATMQKSLTKSEKEVKR